jgi:hypothetical protein
MNPCGLIYATLLAADTWFTEEPHARASMGKASVSRTNGDLLLLRQNLHATFGEAYSK